MLYFMLSLFYSKANVVCGVDSESCGTDGSYRTLCQHRYNIQDTAYLLCMPTRVIVCVVEYVI